MMYERDVANTVRPQICCDCISTVIIRNPVGKAKGKVELASADERRLA